MKLIIEESVVNIFPGMTIGVLKGTITAAEDNLPEKISRMRAEAVDRMKSQILDTSTLSEHPHVAAWRAAYQKFGVKAKTHKPTHEALARRLLKGEGWPNINPIVDIYLTNQAAHLLPHGGYDHTTLTGALRLDISPGSERFEPLGGGEETTNPGEVIYRDDQRIVTRRWNYRDCEVTKITESTKHFVLMIEAPSEAIPEQAIREAARDLVERFVRCFQGTFVFHLVRPRQSEHIFDV